MSLRTYRRPSRLRRFRKRRYGVFRRRRRYNRFNPRMRRGVSNKPEVKTVGGSAGWAAMTSDHWDMFLLNGIGQGTTRSTRVGSNYVISNLYIRLALAVDTNNTSSQQLCRVILLQDKEPHGVAPTVSSIFNDDTETFSFINEDYLRRFKILMNRMFNLTKVQGQSTRIVQIKKALKINVQCNGSNTGNIADIEKGALYLMIRNDQAQYPPNYYYVYRLRYVDN